MVRFLLPSEHRKNVAEPENPPEIEQILDASDLAGALDSGRFKQFLDHVPVAIAISDLRAQERIIYVNEEFERLSTFAAGEVVGNTWDLLSGGGADGGSSADLAAALVAGSDHIGAFSLHSAGPTVNVWANVIEDENGTPAFRLAALAAVATKQGADRDAISHQLHEKDTLLRELQHRVKNNLQMVTALIRMEAKGLPQEHERFSRLAGRVEALALLYQSLSEHGVAEEIDLGIYLSQVASAVMRAHGVEGIRLDLKVDTWPVSINVAMPTGLVVNELLTNSFKHGFKDRDGGTITVHSLVDDHGCRVIVADDGVGLPPGMEWPKPGKLSGLIINSLRQNAKADVSIQSEPGKGVRVTIRFSRAAAAADVDAKPSENN
jgi:two-component sensor histidine kinase